MEPDLLKWPSTSARQTLLEAVSTFFEPLKRTLSILLILTAFGLVGVSIAQWKREAQLRHRIEEVTGLLTAENAARVEAENRATTFEREIERITELRADTEAKLIEVSEQLQLTETDQLQRGVSIALLSTEYMRMSAEVTRLRDQLELQIATLDGRNDSVTEHNTALQTANARLKQVAAERDKAINDLNEQVRAYNELVKKYNQLVK